MKQVETYSQPYNMQVGLSTCCNAPTHTIPASLGEPPFTYCANCSTQCERVWKPLFEEVGRGTYRPIRHEVKLKIK